MANGGRHQFTKDKRQQRKDFQYLSPSTVASFHADSDEKFLIYCATYFVRGGVSEERLPSQPRHEEERRSFDGMEGYFGWGGWGGSQMQWHPEEKIAFAFVPSYLFVVDVGNQKARKLQREVLKCVKNNNNRERSQSVVSLKNRNMQITMHK